MNYLTSSPSHWIQSVISTITHSLSFLLFLGTTFRSVRSLNPHWNNFLGNFQTFIPFEPSFLDEIYIRLVVGVNLRGSRNRYPCPSLKYQMKALIGIAEDKFAKSAEVIARITPKDRANVRSFRNRKIGPIWYNNTLPEIQNIA